MNDAKFIDRLFVGLLVIRRRATKQIIDGMSFVRGDCCCCELGVYRFDRVPG